LPPSDQYLLQDQISYLFERIFSALPPPDSFQWHGIIRLLLRARCHTSSPISSQILQTVISQQIPRWIRVHWRRSAYLLQDIGDATRHWSNESWEHSIELFTHLNQTMTEMYHETWRVTGLGKEPIEMWRGIQQSFIEKTRAWPAPEHLRLYDGYFDTNTDPGCSPTPPRSQPYWQPLVQPKTNLVNHVMAPTSAVPDPALHSYVDNTHSGMRVSFNGSIPS